MSSQRVKFLVSLIFLILVEFNYWFWIDLWGFSHWHKIIFLGFGIEEISHSKYPKTVVNTNTFRTDERELLSLMCTLCLHNPDNSENHYNSFHLYIFFSSTFRCIMGKFKQKKNTFSITYDNFSLPLDKTICYVSCWRRKIIFVLTLLMHSKYFADFISSWISRSIFHHYSHTQQKAIVSHNSQISSHCEFLENFFLL